YGTGVPRRRSTDFTSNTISLPLTAPQLTRPAAAGVRIVLKVRGGVCRHGPTSLCLSPAQGCARHLSKCERLPGLAVNCALVWRQATAAIFWTASEAPWLRVPITLVTGGWGARSCSQRRCNSMTGTPDERPRSARLRLISRPAPGHGHGPAAPRR